MYKYLEDNEKVWAEWIITADDSIGALQTRMDTSLDAMDASVREMRKNIDDSELILATAYTQLDSSAWKLFDALKAANLIDDNWNPVTNP